MLNSDLYHQVEDIARNPPGGIPEGYKLVDLSVHGTYYPYDGQRWIACANYARQGKTGTRRLIGEGYSVRTALIALRERLHDPLDERCFENKGGWDTNWQAGRVKEPT